uniref:SANT domain-containing protein n=1 Tax=Trichobilharzia regenti TaxID=157069 RepID=A0AA85KB58_TRIRE|nr:unnamed protein product [Trichobilharzia regenti]
MNGWIMDLCGEAPVPGRHMGDICALYYSIAAPFKAGNRSKYHNELIEQCYSRAVRAGLVTCRWQKSSSIEETLINTPKPEVIEDPLEGEIKSFLVNLVGASKATELLGNGLLSSPQSIEKPIILHSPEKSTQNVSPSSPIEGSSAFVRLDNDLSPTTMPTTNDSQTSSSEVSSQNDSDSVCQGKGKGHSLPSGAYYDHEEFLSFLNMTSDQLLQEKETELSYLQNINEELHEQIDITEARSRSVLYNMDLLKPSEGFPQISYRWTKTDLAFVLTAMSKYGHDFATIAQSVGTKSESFIRDFYNRFRDRFTLDSIIKSSDHTEEHLTQNPKVDEDSICQDPLVVLTQDHLDMTKILTDGTCVKVSQLAEEMPSHQNENVKIEYEELNHLTAQSQSISDSQTTEDNLRLSPRRHSIPIKLIDSSVLIHTPISESSQISTTPSSSSGRERLRAKRLKRS